MRNYCKSIIAMSILFILWSGSAFAYTITDSYIGDDDHNYGDVIGDLNNFQIYGADVTLSGTILEVTIYTTFAGKSDSLLFQNITNSMGIGYGDLFLTSDYDSSSSEETAWEYVFSLENRWSDSGVGNLYALTTTDDILYSDDFITGGTYRNGQEVAIDTSGLTSLSQGTFYSLDGSGTITFTIDISGTSLLYSDTIGIHWGMTCANDVIEGAASVPEPVTLMLLGTGLIGIGVLTKRRIQK